VALNLAIFPDFRILLYFNKRTDPGVITNGTAIDINKICQFNVFP
jgi:hypothetical protein